MISGDIKAQEVPSALDMLSKAQATGTLTISGESADACVAFERGRILYATSTSVPRLGEILLEQEFLSMAELDAALWVQRQDTEWKSMGTVFCDVNLVTHEIVEAALEAQITRVLGEVFAWTRGTFRFKEGAHECWPVIVPRCRQVEKYALRVALELSPG